MRRKHGRGRGVSFGTIATICLAVLTLALGAGIFLRISGDIEDITLDTGLLTEPLNFFARSVIDTSPEAAARTEQDSMPGGDGQAPQGLGPSQAATAMATAAPTQEPTQPPSRVLRITAVGQVSTGTELRKNAQEVSGLYHFEPVFAPVAGAMSGADLSIATLRTSLTDSTGDFNASNAPASFAAGLAASGVNLLNLATDRILDNGMAGLTKTLSLLDAQGLQHVGGYRTEQEKSAMPILEVSGVKVAVLSYTGAISSNGKKAASEAEIAAAARLLSAESAAADIAACRSAGADIVIVLAHWGSRTDTKPSGSTRELAQTLANAGADIILGTNPTNVHEIERMTVVDAAGASREVFIAYSLGNFLTDESRDTADITGLVLHLTVEWDAQSQRATITDSWYMPTWIMRYKDSGGVSRYRIVPSGVNAIPEGMTESIYANMKKAYLGAVEKLGTTYARPKTEP